MLVLKLLLVPSLVAAVTLATRRWGPRIGGLLTGFPVLAGPVLAFYDIEQGHAFAARAAQGTMVGAIGIAAFCLTYARLCRRAPWTVCVPIGWTMFAVVTGVMAYLPPGPFVGLVVTLVCVNAAARALPASIHVAAARSGPRGDLPFRMLAAAALVLTLTALANRLGARLSGSLTAFPLAATILGVFTHVQRGPDAVEAFFAGFIPALTSFALFCFTLAVGLARFGLLWSLTLALAVQLVAHGLTLWRLTSSPMKTGMAGPAGGPASLGA